LHITAVHVTHDQNEALAIADRLAVMQAGRIVQVGRGEDLYRQPGHPFVAEFLGRVNRLQRGSGTSGLPLGGVALPCLPTLDGHTTLLVRPEDVQIHGGPAPDATSTPWGQARVLQRTFLGDRVHLRLAVADQPEALVCDQPRDCPAAAGDTLFITIDPTRLMPASLKAA
jgi:putative spermidine/putrescine transport system ATP-binding protein